jgi:3-phosphoshikimate 1-carboxyvinyltransferase
MNNPLRLSVPGSKSYTQRALVVSALADAPCTLRDPLDCDDSRTLRAGLRALGATIDDSQATSWVVTPGPLCGPAAPIDCGEAGTTIRFLSAFSLLIADKLQLLGTERLRTRPMDALLEALRDLGVTSSDPAPPAPLSLRRFAELKTSRVSVESGTSSQFASALLLVAPRLPSGMTIQLTTRAGEVVSRPYLTLTLNIMAQQGIVVQESADGRQLVVPHGAYHGGELPIEADWSSAAFLLAAGLISRRPLELTNLPAESNQGDAAIVAFLEALRGSETSGQHHFDLSDCPDLLPPLAAACVFGARPSLITGIAHTRVKESDRVAVLSDAFREVGIDVVEQHDSMRITPQSALQPAMLEPHSDHRMAMAFGLLSLRQPRIEVLDPRCVSKSFPTFWQALERFRD